MCSSELEQEKKNKQLEDGEDKLKIFLTDSRDSQRGGSLVVDLASLEQDLYLVMPAWIQMCMTRAHTHTHTHTN